MTTLTLQVDNPSILAHLKAVLKAIDGVKVLTTTESVTDNASTVDVPNSITLAAMKEAANGNDAGIVNMTNFQSFMSSFE